LKSVQAYRIASNATQQVTTQGFSLGANYYVSRYTLSGNYTWNVLNSGEDDPIIPAYNTPEHKYNISVAGRDLDWNLGKGRCGFMATYKWVQGFLFEGSPQFTGRNSELRVGRRPGNMDLGRRPLERQARIEQPAQQPGSSSLWRSRGWALDLHVAHLGRVDQVNYFS